MTGLGVESSGEFCEEVNVRKEVKLRLSEDSESEEPNFIEDTPA